MWQCEVVQYIFSFLNTGSEQCCIALLCCIVLRCIAMDQQNVMLFCLIIYIYYICSVMSSIFLVQGIFACAEKYIRCNMQTKVCATMQLLVLDFGLTEFDFLLHQDGVRFNPYLITTGNTSPNTAANQNNVQPQHEEIPHRPSQEIFGSGKGWAGLFLLQIHT